MWRFGGWLRRDRKLGFRFSRNLWFFWWWWLFFFLSHTPGFHRLCLLSTFL
jgi:hypothetical protein